MSMVYLAGLRLLDIVGAMAYVLQDGHKTMIPNCIGGQKSLHEL